MKPINLTGQRFGRLTAIKFTGSKKLFGKKYRYWLCQCDCGNEKEITVTNLRSGHTLSCGCLRTEGAFFVGKNNPMSNFCNDCQKPCKVAVIDAGIWPGHTELENASSCCHTDFEDGQFLMCKCGYEDEYHPDIETHEIICPACKRIGCFTKDY